ncbi:MAG TPA: hypothetical protein VEB66_08715 [Opitutaceae bacterium]|nr:hypothetical protein [Opitutaceae bacterium]
MRTAALPLLAAAAFLAPATPASEWPLQLSARAAWAENHSRTSDPNTAKDAAAHEVAASTGVTRQLASGWLASADGVVAREQVPKFDALDAWRFALQGDLRRKFGLGPLAPTLQVGASVQRSKFEEDGRSGTQLQAGVRLGKRLTPSWRAAAGGEWTRYYARHAPFDLHQQRVYVETAWDLTERWQLSAGAARIEGEITANAAGPVYMAALAGGFGPAIQSYYRSIPWHVTGTFGPGWIAYRVDAEADLWWAGISPALGERTSLPLRYERADVVNRVGVRYVSEFWSLALMHRF